VSEQIRERTHHLRGWPYGLLAARLALANGAEVSVNPLAIALTAAVFMALAAPFGTAGEPLIERLGFWVVGASGGFFAGKALEARLRSFRRIRLPATARIAAMVVILTGPAAIAASAAAAMLHHRPIDWALCWKTVPQIAMVGSGFSALFVLADRRRKLTHSLTTQADDPTFGGLLPLRLSGARLFALEAQDHYVRVHTDRGAVLVLTGLEAAIVKLAGVDGQRVHRSWWVARAAVVGVSRGGGRAVIRLVDGVQAPVSRRYARLLRTAGWY